MPCVTREHGVPQPVSRLSVAQQHPEMPPAPARAGHRGFAAVWERLEDRSSAQHWRTCLWLAEHELNGFTGPTQNAPSVFLGLPPPACTRSALRSFVLHDCCSTLVSTLTNLLSLLSSRPWRWE